VARAAVDAGADAITLVNTLPGLVIDVSRRRPALGFGSGGASGPGLLPAGVLATWRVRQAVGVPILGLGGVRRARTRCSTCWPVRRWWGWGRPPWSTRARRSASCGRSAGGASARAFGRSASWSARSSGRDEPPWTGPDGAAASGPGAQLRPPRAIVALDVPTLAGAAALVERLGDACDFYKVGMELFTAEGPAVVSWLRARGRDVFLDLKFHDIPNTVRAATRSAARLGARLVTVHAYGGSAMLAAAVEGAGPQGADGCGVLAVTVLTSHTAESLGATLGRAVTSAEDEVLRLAATARDAGAHGVVCSGHEAATVRAAFGSALRPLVPGVRLAGGASHDQARVVTPSEAARAGAAYVVLGRTVTAAPDPARRWVRR
jgi:orotidine-5'-phosphate decarboxylase